MQHKLSSRERRLERENRDLMDRVHLLIHRSDEVFASRAWRLGRIAAKIERPFRKLFGDRSPHRHLGPRYFHELAPSYSPPLSGRFDDIPSAYVPMNVADAMDELWEAAEPTRAG